MAGKVAEFHHGDQDIHEQVATFHLVMNITKWGCLTFAAVVAFLTIWFCTTGGFMGALITAIIIVALGVTVLRSRPGAGH